jgi:glycerophosphoryl diester phosphodiesterase
MITYYVNLVLLVIHVMSTPVSAPLVIAHRGVSYFAPEETRPSYLLASSLGADYLEADLQRTKDGVLIALHDNNLTRTTNIVDVFPQRKLDPVNSFTWDELQQLDAGSWFNKRYPDRARAGYAGLKILSLEQLIDIALSSEHQPGLYLETKLPEQFPGIEEDLKKVLLEKELYNQMFEDGRPKIILQTFSPESLILLNKHFPEAPKCWLLWKGDACLEEADVESFQNCLAFAKENGATIIGPSFNGDANNYYNLMEDWMVELARKQGFLIHPYTFVTSNDIAKYGKVTDGFFTDRTDLVKDYLNEPHENVDLLLDQLGF